MSPFASVKLRSEAKSQRPFAAPRPAAEQPEQVLPAGYFRQAQDNGLQLSQIADPVQFRDRIQVFPAKPLGAPKFQDLPGLVRAPGEDPFREPCDLAFPVTSLLSYGRFLHGELLRPSR